jgi:hypothetical protein
VLHGLVRSVTWIFTCPLSPSTTEIIYREGHTSRSSSVPSGASITRASRHHARDAGPVASEVVPEELEELPSSEEASAAIPLEPVDVSPSLAGEAHASHRLEHETSASLLHATSRR